MTCWRRCRVTCSRPSSSSPKLSSVVGSWSPTARTERSALASLPNAGEWPQRCRGCRTSCGALEAEARARLHRPAERQTFGVRRLLGFVDQALALPYRLSRLPLDHQAGAISAELWFQVLADVHAATAALAAQIECFAPA